MFLLKRTLTLSVAVTIELLSKSVCLVNSISVYMHGTGVGGQEEQTGANTQISKSG